MPTSLIPRAVRLGAAALLFAAVSVPALACSSPNEVIENVKQLTNAYAAKAASLTTAQRESWNAYMGQFSDAMGRADYPGACAILNQASADLGLGVSIAGAAPAPAPAPATPPPATPQPAQPEPAQPAPAAAAGGAVWTECPRARCWMRQR